MFINKKGVVCSLSPWSQFSSHSFLIKHICYTPIQFIMELKNNCKSEVGYMRFLLNTNMFTNDLTRSLKQLLSNKRFHCTNKTVSPIHVFWQQRDNERHYTNKGACTGWTTTNWAQIEPKMQWFALSYRGCNFTFFLIVSCHITIFATQCYKAPTTAWSREGLDPLEVYCKQPNLAFVKYICRNPILRAMIFYF